MRERGEWDGWARKGRLNRRHGGTEGAGSRRMTSDE